MGNLTPLQAIDAATLVPLVRRALHNDRVAITDWDGSPLRGGATANAHVYRFVGHGHDQTQTTPWSLVLKVWSRREGREDPLQWNYWKREPLVYASGLLDDLPGGLLAPRLLGFIVNWVKSARILRRT